MPGASRAGEQLAGQLGDGTTDDHGTPVAIPGLVGVLEVTTGAFHTCARLADGSVRCWGWNASGQVGNGTTDLQSIPSPVTGLSRAVALAAGRSSHLRRDRRWDAQLLGQEILTASSEEDSGRPVG